jgi:phenylalanyl-tRNA synthetase beta chain
VRVTVPSHRVDVERTADLYEEVIRHVGYGAVPAELPILPTQPGRRHPNWELIDRSRTAAVTGGLTEVMTWSFIDSETDHTVDSHALRPGPPVPLENPLAQTQGVMRRSLLPGLLSAAATNFNQGERKLAVFEQGRVFSLDDGRPSEHERLGIVLSGQGGSREERFAVLKGVVEDLMTRVGLPPVGWQAGGAPWLDAGAGAQLTTHDGVIIGLAGLLSREFVDRWELRHEVAVAELDLGLAGDVPLPRFEALRRFPSVIVDMTVEHPTTLSYSDLENAVREGAGEWVEDLGLEARFVPHDRPGVVRTTLRLVYRHAERSLTQEEVNSAHADLRRRLSDRLGVTFA